MKNRVARHAKLKYHWTPLAGTIERGLQRYLERYAVPKMAAGNYFQAPPALSLIGIPTSPHFFSTTQDCLLCLSILVPLENVFRSFDIAPKWLVMC